MCLLSALVLSAGVKAQSSDSTSLKDWVGRIKVTGTIQGEFRWRRDDPNRLAPARNSSDLYVRRVELGFETSLADWIRSSAVLSSEWIGDYGKTADSRVSLGELQIELSKPGGIGYLNFGLQAQPFGIFENHLISEPLLEDAYLVDKVGVIAGLRGPKELDLSISIYKGPEQMTHLFQSGLFDTNLVTTFTGIPSSVSSWIGSVSCAPLDSTLTIFGAIGSEPGTTRRDLTVDAGFSLQAPFQRKLTCDFEMSQALQRDLYQRASIEHDEGLLAIALGYSFKPTYTPVHNRGLYQARREFVRSRPSELAVRYEYFNDDGLTADLHAWTLKDRLSLAGRFALAQSKTTLAYFAIEIGVTQYRVYNPPPPSMVSDHSYGAQMRLGVDF